MQIQGVQSLIEHVVSLCKVHPILSVISISTEFYLVGYTPCEGPNLSLDPLRFRYSGMWTKWTGFPAEELRGKASYPNGFHSSNVRPRLTTASWSARHVRLVQEGAALDSTVEARDFDKPKVLQPQTGQAKICVGIAKTGILPGLLTRRLS